MSRVAGGEGGAQPCVPEALVQEADEMQEEDGLMWPELSLKVLQAG